VKLSDLKPCASCGGPLLQPPQDAWYAFRSSLAMLNCGAAREVLGMTMMLGGNLRCGPLRLAEQFAPCAEEAITILAEKDGALWTEGHVCFECASTFSLLELVEAVDRRRSEEENRRSKSDPTFAEDSPYSGGRELMVPED